MTEGNQLMTINVPKEFLKRFDNAIKDQYPDRSEAIRQLMREYLAKVEK